MLTWIEHVKEFCKQNNIKYKEALMNDECKKLYNEKKNKKTSD